jgi:hypothetical protein
MNHDRDSDTSLTPVLFLVFNRFDTTKKVFEQIRKAKPLKFYIASDGPRNKNEELIVEQIRNYILENIDWNCEVTTFFKEENIGCKLAVQSAITTFFEYETKGIILEDDCLPDLTFFRYCHDLLNKYENDTRVMQISGTNLASEYVADHDNSYFLSRYGSIWGWATWKRAWDLYDDNFSAINEFSNKKAYLNYFPSSKMGWHRLQQFKECMESKTISSWDFPWAFSKLINNALIIVPNQNLIKNIGFGENSTHTNYGEEIYSIDSTKIDFPLKHPKLIFIDKKSDIYFFNKFYKSAFYRNNIISILQKFRLYNITKKIFKFIQYK